MKQLTILDLATILQLDDSLKEELKNNFDKYSEGLKYGILDTLWNNFYKLRDELAKLKYQELLKEIELGKSQLTNDLYLQAQKRVWKDFEDMLSGKKQEVDQMEQIRVKLQSLTNKAP